MATEPRTETRIEIRARLCEAGLPVTVACPYGGGTHRGEHCKFIGSGGVFLCYGAAPEEQLVLDLEIPDDRDPASASVRTNDKEK